GFEPMYLCAREAGSIRGVLPLFLVKSLLFGKSLVGVPVGVYGGPVAVNAQAAHALIDADTNLARERGVGYLEIRGNPHGQSQFDSSQVSGPWSRKDLYCAFLSDIAATDDANLALIPRKQRRMIRQGEKHGLTATFDN